MEPAFVGHSFGVEQTAQDLERLLEPRRAVIERDPERVELRAVPARAHAEVQSAAADLGERRRLLGQDRGVVERERGDERADPDAVGHGCHGGQEGPRFPRTPFWTVVATVEVVVADPDRVEADLLGRASRGHVLGPPHLALDLRQLHADAKWSAHPSNSFG
jgi:hypothetical protein